MLFQHAMRAARTDAGLSFGELRLRILRHFETAPAISTLKDLERGIASAPQDRNLTKIKRALPTLERRLAEPKA